MKTLLFFLFFCSYHSRSQTLNFDSARQSSIEALRSERGASSATGKGNEEDRLSEVAASQNSKFEADCGIPILSADEPLKARLGEMIMVGFRGYECPVELSNQLESGLVGGVVLFDYDHLNKEFNRNIHSTEQIKELCHSLKLMSKHSLWIAIDQEGGLVSRLKPDYGFPATLSQQELGALDDLLTTRKQSKMTGLLLSQLGINVNYAPVVDLNLNPESLCVGKKKRSFSSQPSIVTQHAKQVILGHRESGVFCVLKHFPGHGSAEGDTHEGFVDISNTWSEEELIPYEQLILSHSVDMIMTAHIFNKHLDPKYPASISKLIINDILRGRLGYEGVVVSDDLQMKAIANYYTLEETVEKALEAGLDVLLFANQQEYDPLISNKVVDIIDNLVSTGKIRLERIEKSLERIGRLKKS